MNFWFRPTLTWQALLLLPLSALVWLISQAKRLRRATQTYARPVVVVGNLTVGGTGKTPMIIWLVELCQRHDIRVAVVSRGYGAKPDRAFPFQVTDQISAKTCGDEPKLLAQRLNIPVVVDPNRHRAVNFVLAHHRVDLIISDDGLQHYAMHRDIEILMLDGLRGLGNGCLLPAGPLRESAARLKSVDFIVVKQHPLPLSIPFELAHLTANVPRNAEGKTLLGGPVKICSGIGNFSSFQRSVSDLGYEVIEALSFADHQLISAEVLLDGQLPIIITEKDAIKLDLKRYPHIYVLTIAFDFSAEFECRVLATLREQIHEKNHHHTGTL
ncbi:tetraacyldisaccharide 4'-kinase [Reinekea sp.]|jgi:tetraacyldisaccharide 4'-kinase|uniref:tetraacyldisaccharide 4'-kinase n=1 Tax=Reinekea sp. TaxID=1970455 RepID=UPI002A820AF4|nr:tetraacyldisaccharide 4'-kinase [Reinekea sp.]